MDRSLPGPSVPLSMGSARQEYSSESPFPSPGDLPDPGTEPASPALVGRFFTTEPPKKLSKRVYLWTNIFKLFLKIKKIICRDCSTTYSNLPELLFHSLWASMMTKKSPWSPSSVNPTLSLQKLQTHSRLKISGERTQQDAFYDSGS